MIAFAGFDFSTSITHFSSSSQKTHQLHVGRAVWQHLLAAKTAHEICKPFKIKMRYYIYNEVFICEDINK